MPVTFDVWCVVGLIFQEHSLHEIRKSVLVAAGGCFARLIDFNVPSRFNRTKHGTASTL